MTRIERILKNARMVLADKEEERWTNEDLLSMLDEGHKDLCQHSQILKTHTNVPLVFGSPYFPLPEDCWQLTRAAYSNSVLPFVTHAELDNSNHGDNLAYDWQAATGQPEAVIYDRRNMLEGMVYPIPTIDDADQATFSSPFGVTTALADGSVEPLFGLANNPLVGSVEQFGVLTDYVVAPKLKCYYLQIPSDLQEVTDELVTPRMFDTALKYYVIGNAFLMDIAEEYQAKGLQQLGFYNRELDLANKTSSRDHQQASASRTAYRTGF